MSSVSVADIIDQTLREPEKERARINVLSYGKSIIS